MEKFKANPDDKLYVSSKKFWEELGTPEVGWGSQQDGENDVFLTKRYSDGFIFFDEDRDNLVLEKSLILHTGFDLKLKIIKDSNAV